MIFGVGVDIFEVGRMEKWVARGREYLTTVFTEKEIKYCESRARKSESYAGRYAAKEAVLKALGTGWRDGLGFSEIEILDDELGKPRVFLRGEVEKLFDRQNIRQTTISISHTKETAIAVAILEQ